MAPAKRPAKRAAKKTTKKATRKAPRKAPKKATKKATKKSPRKATGKRTTPAAPLVTKSRVKDAAGDKRVASEFYDALDERVRELVARAAQRAESNGRSTLRSGDL